MAKILKSAGAQSATYLVRFEAAGGNYLTAADYTQLPEGPLKTLLTRTFPYTGAITGPEGENFYSALAETGFHATLNWGDFAGPGVSMIEVSPGVGVPTVTWEGMTALYYGVLRIAVNHSLCS
jgi:hypothetical protein